MTGPTRRRVLLDACVPQWLRRELTEFDVQTAQFAGLDQIPDGELLVAIEFRFDVLVTLDTGLVHENRIAGRPFAVVVLRVSEQTPAAFRALAPGLNDAIKIAMLGEIVKVGGR